MINLFLVFKVLSSFVIKDFVDVEVVVVKVVLMDVVGFCDMLIVVLGVNLIKLVLGCVLIEVDVNLLFDVDVLVCCVNVIIEDYDCCGISSDCILIKLVLMWEGICVVE